MQRVKQCIQQMTNDSLLAVSDSAGNFVNIIDHTTRECMSHCRIVGTSINFDGNSPCVRTNRRSLLVSVVDVDNSCLANRFRNKSRTKVWCNNLLD